MRIGIVGAGAIGGYLGTRLALAGGALCRICSGLIGRSLAYLASSSSW